MKIAAALFSMLLLARSAQAGFSNYNSILIGDQAAGMGGAAAAVVGDASGCAWYNPATCALLRGQSFSAAVGIYKKYDTIYGDNIDFVQAGLKANQGFFRALPSSTGSIIRMEEFMKDYTFTLSIVTPEYDTFKGDLYNSNDSKTTLSYTDESLWVGPSISKRISQTEAMGLTVYYTARSYTKTLSDRTILSGGQSKSYQEERNLTQNSVVAVLGYTKRLSESWRMGASIRFPSLHVAGKASYFDNQLDAGTNVSTNNFTNLSTNARIPARYTLGFAYEEPGSIVMAFDLSTYSRENYRDLNVDAPNIAEDIEHKQIVNAHFGMEFNFTNWLKMRYGVFSNFSAHPDPDASRTSGQADHVDQVGWSSNLALRKGKITYTFGGYYTGGKGRSVQRLNQNVQVINKTQQVFTMLVGTSYFY